MDTWEQFRFARTFFFSFKDIWRPIILGTKSHKKTSGLKKSLLGPLWGLSYFSKGDTLPFSSPPSFSRRNPPVEAGVWNTMEAGRGECVGFACSCFLFPQPQKPIKAALIEGDKHHPTSRPPVWTRLHTLVCSVAVLLFIPYGHWSQIFLWKKFEIVIPKSDLQS